VSELNVTVLQSPGNLGGPDERLHWFKSQLNTGLTGQTDLLVLPELFQCGYNTYDAVNAEASDGPFAHAIAQLCIANNIAIAYGYAERLSGEIYNSAQCIDKSGFTIGHHRKLLLPPGFETTLFKEGDACSVFSLGGLRLSILICYDIEFPENARQAATSNVDLIIVPTALTQQWGVVSEKLIPTRSFENGVYIAYANHCGTENGITYYGGSCIVAPDGSDLDRANSDYKILHAKVVKENVVDAQKRLPYLTERMKLDWVKSTEC